MKKKIHQLFYVWQGHQITDEELYRNNGSIPVITGNNEVKGSWDDAIVKKEDLPCISYPTKGNSGVCFVQNSIFNANNTAVLITKPEWKNKLILEWITFKLSKIFPNLATSKKGVSYLNKELVQNLEIDVPEKEIQKEEIDSIIKLREFRTMILLIIQKTQSKKSSSLKILYKEYQGKKVPIKKILGYMGGNSGLTEEFLYTQIQSKEEKKYLLLTGSIDYSKGNFVHKFSDPKKPDKQITVLEGKPIIHVVRKGYAGYVAYFEAGNYTINDDAYLLYLRDDIEYKINLQWLMYELKDTFSKYGSSSGNKTWGLTGFFSNVFVDIPLLEEQNNVLNNYVRLEKFEKNLANIIKRIDELIKKL